jgi:hypothetical protein
MRGIEFTVITDLAGLGLKLERYPLKSVAVPVAAHSELAARQNNHFPTLP